VIFLDGIREGFWPQTNLAPVIPQELRITEATG